MNSGRWNAAPSVESPLSTRLLPMLNRSPLDATMANDSAVVVGQVIDRLVVALEFRHQHAGHVEDVPLVGQGIAAVAAAVGRVAQQVGARIDVVLLRRVVDGVRPGVRARRVRTRAPVCLRSVTFRPL